MLLRFGCAYGFFDSWERGVTEDDEARLGTATENGIEDSEEFQGKVWGAWVGLRSREVSMFYEISEYGRFI